jgi:hypothetical protein
LTPNSPGETNQPELQHKANEAGRPETVKVLCSSSITGIPSHAGAVTGSTVRVQKAPIAIAVTVKYDHQL